MNQFLSDVARSAVPAVADFCLVYVLDGPRLRCAGVAHRTHEGTRLLRALARVYRITRDDPDSTVAQTVRSGRAAVRAAIRPETFVSSLATARDRRVLDLHSRLAATSAVAVPMEGRTRTLGAIVLGYSTSGRRYSAADLPMARHLAHHAALLVENARVMAEVAKAERRVTRMLRARS